MSCLGEIMVATPLAWWFHMLRTIYELHGVANQSTDVPCGYRIGNKRKHRQESKDELFWKNSHVRRTSYTEGSMQTVDRRSPSATRGNHRTWWLREQLKHVLREPPKSLTRTVGQLVTTTKVPCEYKTKLFWMSLENWSCMSCKQIRVSCQTFGFPFCFFWTVV